MKPGQFARAECPDHLPDGTCGKTEPSSLWDFRLPLPAWLTPEQWDRHVAKARDEGSSIVTLDKRTGAVLDVPPLDAEGKPRRPNRYRADLYYCDGCGQRMGGGGDLCPGCSGRPAVSDEVDRRCKVLKGERCGQFEQTALPLADQGPPKDHPSLQLRRERARSEYLDTHVLPGSKHQPRRCPDCGGELPKGKQFCGRCRRHRRRASERAARNRSCPNGAHKPLSAKAPILPFSEVGAQTPTPPKSANFCCTKAVESALL